jgi:hypothetical protein
MLSLTKRAGALALLLLPKGLLTDLLSDARILCLWFSDF